MKIRVLLLSVLLVLFVSQMSLVAQDTVTVNAEIRGFLIFRLDVTDAGGSLFAGDYSTAETSNLGLADAGGLAITGGDALVTGETGIPVDATGLDLSAPNGFLDPNCVGAFYRFFNTVGTPNATNHDDAALGIFALGSRVSSYDLTTSAILTPGTGDATVTIDQLKWKDNATTGGSGYADYAAFSAAPVSVASGGAGAFYLLIFNDYGLLVEFVDTSGTYTWTLTYTLTTT